MDQQTWIGLGIIGIVVIIIGQYYVNRFRNIKKLNAYLKENWGKRPAKIKPERLSGIATYFIDFVQKVKNKDGQVIDDITWNDLSMDLIFERINNTSSTAGEEYLYAMLRTPTFNKKELTNRENMIRYFSQNPEVRKKVQLELALLGKVDDVHISNYFSDSDVKTTKKKLVFDFLAILNLLCTVIMIINFPLGITLFIVSFFINVTLYYQSKNLISAELESLSYVVRLLGCTSKILKLDVKEMNEVKNSLTFSFNKLKSIRKKSFYMLYSTGDVFVEYVKIAYLRELAGYESILNIIKKNRQELKNVYEMIGLLDSLIAIASYREGLQTWCTPTFDPINNKHLQFKKAYHPLIEIPVKNSLDLNKSVLITGSNASGKSTFIKTMGINAILAQTIHTCAASVYESSMFMVFTSMALRDDLMKKESYYIAELKSLKRIIDALEEERPILCFVDEVLRGTNTIERIAASSRILKYFSLSNCVSIAATHDLELTNILSNHFENYHFQETVTEDGVEFDYIVYPEKATTRNAIKLLKFMGYPEEIVENSEAFAKEFISEGKWGRI